VLNLTNKCLLDWCSSTNTEALDLLKKSGDLNTQMQKVFQSYHIRGKRGLTDEEGGVVLDMKNTSFIARRHDLIKKFPDTFYSDTFRIGSSGLKNRVWRLKE